MAAEEPYKITISITSECNGVVKQRHIVEEFSPDEKTHVHKNFVLDEFVTKGAREGMEYLATQGGYLKK